MAFPRLNNISFCKKCIINIRYGNPICEFLNTMLLRREIIKKKKKKKKAMHVLVYIKNTTT